MNNKHKVILASASPRRAELLRQIGLTFSVYPSTAEENITAGITIEQQVEKWALLKAEDVASKLNDGIVIGADTVVALDNKILRKPESKTEAEEMLTSLSGREHIVMTGVAVIEAKSNKTIVRHEKTFVEMKNNTHSTIKKYVDCGEPMDKAGSYGIQARGAILVKKIRGDFSNVVGLPLGLTCSSLADLGFEVTSCW